LRQPRLFITHAVAECDLPVKSLAKARTLV
jgi:hypothetical protein